ncbi:MAG: TSUP family transporter [Pseudomonadota bacterium]
MTLLFLILGGFSAGFVDSIAGGGGLISLPTLLALGLPPTLALGSNKVIAIGTGAASSLRYGFGRCIDWRTITPVAIGAGLAAAAGAFAATRTDPSVLRPIILVGLIAVATYLAFKRQFGRAPGKKRWKHPIGPFLFVLPIAFYDGFFGPGTGTFLMMGFVLLIGQELLNASANSRYINFATTLGSFALFAGTGNVDFGLVLPAATASFAGALTGASISIRNGSRVIRPVFLTIVWALIAKLAWDFLRQ